MNMYPYSKPHGNRADERFWFCPAPSQGPGPPALLFTLKGLLAIAIGIRHVAAGELGPAWELFPPLFRGGRRARCARVVEFAVQFGSHAFPLRALTRAVRVQLQAPLRQPPGLVELRQLVAQAATWSPPRSDCHLVSSEAVGAELP